MLHILAERRQVTFLPKAGGGGVIGGKLPVANFCNTSLGKQLKKPSAVVKPISEDLYITNEQTSIEAFQIPDLNTEVFKGILSANQRAPELSAYWSKKLFRNARCQR